MTDIYTSKKRVGEPDPVDIARNKKVVDVLRMFEVNVKSERCLIRCFRPENHKNGDKHPSMVVDPIRNRARCFVCDEKYLDAIEVTKIMGGMGFMEAVRFLSKKDFRKYSAKPIPKKKDDFDIIGTSFDINKLNIKPTVREFLKRQNTEFDKVDGQITMPMIQYYCGVRGIDLDLLAKSGLKQIPADSSFPDFKKDAIAKYQSMVPHRKLFDPAGNVLFYHLRAFSGAPDGRKELIAIKCPMSSCYSAPGLFMPGQFVFICEGHVDALTAASRGVNAISVPGGIASFNRSWISEFKKRKLIPVMAFDSEPEASRKSYAIMNDFLSEGVIAYKLIMPAGEDVNSYFLKHERAVQRLKFLETPVSDASSSLIGSIKWNFDKEKQMYGIGEWESRYSDRHAL